MLRGPLIYFAESRENKGAHVEKLCAWKIRPASTFHGALKWGDMEAAMGPRVPASEQGLRRSWDPFQANCELAQVPITRLARLIV